MKTLQQVRDSYKSETIDGRDISRISQFLPVDMFEAFGISLKEGAQHNPRPFTRGNILEQLKLDVDFGFEKALNQRGISSGIMYSVVSMWNWILEEGLENFDDYAQYGLPLFKATAIKYDFPNPIGEDTGSEEKYAS